MRLFIRICFENAAPMAMLISNRRRRTSVVKMEQAMSTKTVYTWNPLTDSVIEETDGSGNVNVTYTNKPSAFGPLISENRAGTTSYYHADAIGSTRLTTNSSQATVDSFTFDAFGNTVASTQPTATPYQWCGTAGYQTDPVLGSTYARARIYNPKNAGWSSVDPLALYGPRAGRSSSAYGYVGNRPVCSLDPSGSSDLASQLEYYWTFYWTLTLPDTQALSAMQGTANIVNAAVNQSIDFANIHNEMLAHPFTPWVLAPFLNDVPDIPPAHIGEDYFIREDPTLRAIGGNLGLIGLSYLAPMVVVRIPPLRIPQGSFWSHQ
jgi:RHS repeat-associated protein